MSTIKIISHNVWGMYAKDVVKKVSNRNSLMKKVYYEKMPDVIGAQEFSQDIRTHNLPEMLSPDYAELDLSAEVAACGVANLFTPVFYLYKKYDIIEKGFFLYDRAFNNSDSKSIAYAALRNKQTGEVFSVCNTHFWWKSGPEHDAARVVNAMDILKIAARLPKPVFVMGDLNCISSSEAYKTLVAGGLCDVRFSAKEATTDDNTHHPYPAYDEAKDEFTAAPYPGTDAKNIDYIFIDREHSGNVKKFEVLNSSDALSTSDHCPILAEYSF
jgi:endonuclease/exonuclease/phosphatase family metal-dependent hydrolase